MSIDHPAEDIRSLFVAVADAHILNLMLIQHKLADLALDPSENRLKEFGQYIKDKINREIELRDRFKHQE